MKRTIICTTVEYCRLPITNTQALQYLNALYIYIIIPAAHSVLITRAPRLIIIIELARPIIAYDNHYNDHRRATNRYNDNNEGTGRHDVL